jgi:hypothetical protein
MNPYLVKELRQLTRSKVVSGGLVLLLFGQFVAAAIAIPVAERTLRALSAASASTPGGVPDAPPLGAILAAVFGGILGLALTCVLPFLVFARFVSENPKGRTTVELATAAPPSAVIDGKVQAGLVLAAALVAGSMPFQLLCVALRGVDFVSVLFSCAGTLLACSVQLHFAALFAASRTASAGRRWATMVVFQFFFGQYALFGGVMMAVAGAMGAHGAPLPLRSSASAWIALAGLLAATSLNLLLRASATRALAPPSTDRDRVPRLTLLALWGVWGAIAAAAAAIASEATFLWIWGGAFLAALLLSHLSAAGSPPGIPRRVLAERPASRRGRLLRFPFSAGYPGALVLFAILAPATALLAWVGARAVEPSAGAGETILAWIAAALYALSVPMVLRGVLLRSAPRRLHIVPQISLLALLLLQLLPVLLFVGHGNPPKEFPFFLGGLFTDTSLSLLHFLFAALAFLFGLGAILSEVVSAIRAYLAPPSTTSSPPALSAPPPTPPILPAPPPASPAPPPASPAPPPASPMPPPASPMPPPLPAPSAPAAQS